MENKFAWISTPDELWDDKKEMITTALESGIDHVLDLDDIQLDAGLDRTVCEQYELAIERHELTFHGLCQTCMHNS